MQLDFNSATASTRAQAVAIRPANTRKAYDSKKIEFMRFCDAMYGHEPGDCCIVAKEKAFMFIWYHDHRPKRTSTPRNRARGELGDNVSIVDSEDRVSPFNAEEYRGLLNTYGTPLDNTGSTTDALRNAVAPPDCLGESQVKGYSAAVRDIWLEQQTMGTNPRVWDVKINDAGLKELMSIVRKREAHVKHKNAGEKINNDVIPFLLATRIPDIVRAFWDKALTPTAALRIDQRGILSALRDRFIFSMTTCAILRGESLF
jgi:hypothetical protein